jgi:C1A family cysteine protease
MSFKLIASAVLATSAVLLGLYMLQDNSSVHTTEELNAFRDFKIKYQKSYANLTENAFRFEIFRQNFKLINDHKNNTEATFTVDVNKFADLSYTEFKSKYLINDMTKIREDANNCTSALSATSRNLKSAVDWAAEGKVQKVKNQEQCGSCWAFSTVGSMESAYAIFSKDKTLLNLSEQELVDCSGDYGNQGCNGGIMSAGFAYIADHGIHEEDAYPYRGVDQTCKASNTSGNTYTVKDCVLVDANTDALTKAIAVQPVSVAFYVNILFQFYSGGIFNPFTCGGEPNHGVLAVGYDLDQDFYKVKNSWGASWGEEGYFRIKIGSGKGTCDMAGSGASVYPLIDA